MSQTRPLAMQETNGHYIFPKKILFREMVQDYDGLRLRKSLEAIKSAKFTKKIIDLFDTHDTVKNNLVGNVRNIYLDVDKWRGDVYFQKKKLTNDQKQQLLTGEKRDLSIGFEYNLVLTPELSNIDGDQTKIIVDHIAWVDHGRCPLPQCGLDQKRFANRLKLEDQANTSLRAHEIIKLPKPEQEPEIEPEQESEVINMTECDEKDKRIKELETKLEAKDSSERVILNEKIETLTTQLKTKDEAFKTEKEKLVKEKAALQKVHDAQKVILDQAEEEEKAKLIKEIVSKSTFTEEELKEWSLEKLKEAMATIQKAKPVTVDGYPPGTDGQTGADNKQVSSLTEPTDLRTLIVKPLKATTTEGT